MKQSPSAIRGLRAIVFLVAGLVSLMPGSVINPTSVCALDFTQRSLSRSQQFIVYCPDVGLRMAVTGFIETTKSGVLQILGIGDHWKLPIVINLVRPATTDTGMPLTQIRFFDTESGGELQVDVALRQEQFREVRFPQQIIRALLLELAYREHSPRGGEHYFEPPAWLVEGLAEKLQARTTASPPNAALFKQLIDTGRLPKIREFLASKVESMDTTSRTIYAACSSSLVDLLVGLPNGTASLASMVHGIPSSDGDSTNLLLKYFPGLGGDEVALEKWWTLGIARSSAADRHVALSVSETDARISKLLTFQVVTDEKKGTKTAFTLAEYEKFIKLRTARAALFVEGNTIAALLPQAHPLLRPVLINYQKIVGDLSRGNTRRTEASLRDMDNYRAMIVERMDKIGDYLNWFEATQMPERSGAFDSYLKAAAAADSAQPPKRNDAISQYVDQVAREVE